MHFLNFHELQTKMTGNKVIVTSRTVKWQTVTVTTALQLRNARYVVIISSLFGRRKEILQQYIESLCVPI
jgi:hypothetical protein